MNEKLELIFREVLNEPELELSDTLNEKDVASWNSFNNVLLINNIEKAFSVKFSLTEILKLKNVGDIKNLLASKLGD